jgi:NTE family protein
MQAQKFNFSNLIRCTAVGFLLAGVLGISLTFADTRPRIGLVLGGGGARGAAHIGVLEVLREQRVQIDCVAGTSMGGLVSGAFAAGLTPDEMLKAMDQADWRDMFMDSPAASDISPRNRNISRRFLPGSEIGITPNGAVPLPGVVSGQKIKLFFNKLVRSEYGEPQIENLKMPLSVIATDLVSGDKVVFQKGSLTKAMRASMSVPGLMSPVEDGGTRLVDGGLVDNVPIDEVRKRCNPDIVIAVNVGSPLLKADEIGSLVSVAGQMVNILTEQNVTKSLASLKPTDIYIKPNLEGITAGEFERYAETAKRGRVAAEAVVAQLRKLSQDDNQYKAWWASVVPDHSKLPVVDSVEVAGIKRTNKDVTAERFKGYEGKPLDPTRIEQDMMRTYGENEFDSVDYSLVPARDRNILRVTPVEKEFGPNYVRAGLNLESTLGREATYDLRLAYHKTWLNSLGGEWLTGGQIGNTPKLFTEFYQPLDPGRRFFAEAGVSYQREPLKIWQNNKNIADYKVDEVRLDLMGGMQVGMLGGLRLGWSERRREANLETGTLAIESGSKTFGGWSARVDFDQYDRLYLPTRGWAIRGSYFDSPSENYSKAELDLRLTQSIGGMILHGRVYGAGSPRGELPAYDPVAMGGFLNMSGFARRQVVGDSVSYGSIRAEKVVGQLPLGLRGDMRVGMALESGKVGGRYTETNLDGWQNSLAIYAGGETPLGPVYIGYGYAPNGMSNLYLFVGTP